MTDPSTTAAPGVAVIGCGYWGRNVARAFAQTGSLVAVHDRNPDAASKTASLHGVQDLGLEELLQSSSVQAVAVAANASEHFALTKRALENGKHAFVEKPLALNLQEANALCDLAERSSLTLMVGHLLQYHPAFLALRGLISRRELGDLHYLYSTRLNLGRFRTEENILWSFAPHDISMILSLVGEEPAHVFATGGWYLSKDIADVTTTHLRFPGGVRAHVFVSWLHPSKEQRLVVIGSEAMAVFDDGEPWETKLRLYRHSISWDAGVPEPIRAEAEAVPITPREPLEAEASHFLTSIVNGTPPRTDGREGLRVLRVLHQAEGCLRQERDTRR